MKRRPSPPLLVPAALLCTIAIPAFADQLSGKPVPDALPGVDGGYSIVSPAPEPMQAPAAQDGYTFQAGNTDIRVSGSVSFEIGPGLSRMGGQRHR